MKVTNPKVFGLLKVKTDLICAFSSVGRAVAFGEVIQLGENANASSNLAFSTISYWSGVRIAQGAPPKPRKFESFRKILYNIYRKSGEEPSKERNKVRSSSPTKFVMRLTSTAGVA